MSTSFKCGANEIRNANFDGETIADAIEALGMALNITADHDVRVNGVEQDGDYEIQAEDSIEFVKEAGAKGSEIHVVVSHGANELTVVSRDGSTVAEVLRGAASALGIVGMDGITIKRNGVEVDGSTRVSSGDRIEANKTAGTKG
jgi:hypothetical protein